MLTAGSNQLLHLLAECLCNPGDVVLCAAPSYLVFLGTLLNLEAQPFGVAVDSQGMIPEALEEALTYFERRGELERVKAVYLVSYFDNPAGVTMPLARKGEILEVVRRWSSRQHIYLIEDAAYRQLRYTSDDIPSLRKLDPRGEHVVVAETFSKSFSPGIRVGWGILPGELVAPVCDLKGNIDFGSPNFSQHLMAEVLDLGLFEPHVEQLRATYRLKMEAMLAAAEEHLRGLPGVSWEPPTGGLYLWLRLPEGCDAGPAGRLFDLAVKEGMFYVPGQFCYPSAGEAVRPNTLRLSFGVQSCERIAEGIAALARALRACGPD